MNGCGNGKVFKVTHYTAFSLFVNSFVDISAQLMSATHPASVRQSEGFPLQCDDAGTLGEAGLARPD